MGLKTAASWFGNTWSVTSSELGSDEEYHTEINIAQLREQRKNSVQIITKKVEKISHGTKVVIKDLTKKLNQKIANEKTANLLKSMYRRDLASGKVAIVFNGSPLKFSPYECLEYKGKKWRKDLDFSFVFSETKYTVKGFVGILKKGGYDKAGLNLFRRNRVVVGGDLDDLNYKPKMIFGQKQSEVSLKLFGELDLDDFPVNQAKDGFVWDDGLEDAFLSELQKNIPEFISIAKKTKKSLIDEEDFSNDNSEKVYKQSKKSIEGMLNSSNEEKEHSQNTPDSASRDENSEFDRYIEESNEIEAKSLASPRKYTIPINLFESYVMTISWERSDSKVWIKHVNPDDLSSNVVINVNHPFFKPYINKTDFKSVLERFVAAYILSIRLAERDAGSERKIIPSVITNKLNDFLGKMKD